MKKMSLLLMTMVLSFCVNAQDITGQWNGLLKTQGIELRVILHITKSETGYSSTMDSPDQNAIGIPVTSTVFENNILKFEISNMMASYSGELKENKIIGVLKQNGQEITLSFTRNVAEKKTVDGYQEAHSMEPIRYHGEDIFFKILSKYHTCRNLKP